MSLQCWCRLGLFHHLLTVRVHVEMRMSGDEVYGKPADQGRYYGFFLGTHAVWRRSGHHSARPARLDPVGLYRSLLPTPSLKRHERTLTYCFKYEGALDPKLPLCAAVQGSAEVRRLYHCGEAVLQRPQIRFVATHRLTPPREAGPTFGYHCFDVIFLHETISFNPAASIPVLCGCRSCIHVVGWHVDIIIGCPLRPAAFSTPWLHRTSPSVSSHRHYAEMPSVEARFLNAISVLPPIRFEWSKG